MVGYSSKEAQIDLIFLKFISCHNSGFVKILTLVRKWVKISLEWNRTKNDSVIITESFFY